LLQLVPDLVGAIRRERYLQDAIALFMRVATVDARNMLDDGLMRLSQRDNP
jgi:hypothetical protein